MAKPRLLDAMDTLAAAVVNAINAAGLTTPNQVGYGWPVAPDIVSILNNQQYQVTLFDHARSARNTARYPGQPYFQVTAPAGELDVTVTPPASIGQPWVLTFTGTVSAGLGVHTYVGSPTTDAPYVTTGTDTLDTIATAVAAAVNVALNTIQDELSSDILDESGGIISADGSTVYATASGNAVSIVGTPFARGFIAGSGGVLGQEVNRVARVIQVSVWAPDPTTRDNVTNAIESGVTSDLAPFLTLSDGTPLYCLLAVRAPESDIDDTAQSAYSAYVGHVCFEVEYGIIRYVPGYVIGAVQQQLEAGAAPEIVDTVGSGTP